MLLYELNHIGKGAQMAADIVNCNLNVASFLNTWSPEQKGQHFEVKCNLTQICIVYITHCGLVMPVVQPLCDGSGDGMLLDGTKSLPEQMLPYIMGKI